MPDVGAPNTGFGMIPPGVDPSDYYAQVRAQQLAEIMSRMAFTPGGVTGPPQNYGPIRSRMTALNPISNIVAAYMARKQMDKANELGVKNQSSLLGAFSNADQSVAGGGDPSASSAVPGGATPAPPPASSPEPPPLLARPDQPPPNMGPASQNAPPTTAAGGGPQVPIPGGGGGGPGPTPPGVSPSLGGMGAPPSMPLNPLGLHPALAAATYMRDPAKYAELVAGTPEWRTAMYATGGNIAQAQHLLVNKMIKDGTIDLRQGGEAIIHNADGTITRLRNPNLVNGVEPIYGPHGEVMGSYVIPGMPQAEQTLETAKKTGQEAGTLHELHKPGGTGYVFGIPNVPGAPPQLPAFSGTGPSQMGAPPGGAPPGVAPPIPGGPPGGAPPATRNWFGGAGGGGAAPGGMAPPASPNAPGSEVPANVSPWVAKLPARQDLNTGFGENLFAEKRIEYQAQKANELQDKYGAEADLADQRMAFNAIVLKNLPQAETGPLADFLTTVRAEAAQLGIPTSIIPGWASTAPTVEMRKALVRNAIVTLKPNFGGRPAASEFQVLKEEANPSPEMTAVAIKRLTQIDNELAAMQKQRAGDFDWAMANNKDPARFESLYAVHSPTLERIARFLHPPSQQEVQAEIARRNQQRAQQVTIQPGAQ